METKQFNSLDEYISHFRKWLSVERKAQIQFHLDEIKRLSGIERQRRGRALLDMKGTRVGRDPLGLFLVKYSRMDGRQLPDTEISPGDVVLVSRGRPTGKEATGTVVSKTRFTIVVGFSDAPPRYAYGKGIRIDLFVNDTPFTRMNDALTQLKDNPFIANIVLNKFQVEKTNISVDKFINCRLNESQKKAVKNALETHPVFLVHGPPGTGKTTTVTEVICQLAREGKKVLATADSNIAVDNLAEKLIEAGLAVVRVGTLGRLLPSVEKVSLATKMQEHKLYSQLQKLQNEFDAIVSKRNEFQPPTQQWRRGMSDEAIKKMARQNRSFRGVPAHKIKAMAKWLEWHDKATKIKKDIELLQNQIISDIIKNSDVVCATNIGSGIDILANAMFDVVVIDEATQSLEPACLIPMLKGSRIIMAGDHKQLPPTVISYEAMPHLSITLFERLIETRKEEISSMLKVQYRMNERIMQFPSQEFYNGQLIADPSVADRTLADYPISGWETLPSPFKEIWNPDRVIVWKDVPVGTEKQHRGSTSFSNEYEAQFIEKLVKNALQIGIKPEDIGVISPYEDQIALMKRLFGDIEGLEIKTVDGFQGREKEVIIISFVRANTNGNIGFLNDLRRFNVSITRAKTKLIIVGCSQTLETHPTYARFINYIKSLDGFIKF
ncbi:MAG: IGHMBP2 family helicase [Chlorobi bacterium]|nr:IGHMBP2 family helicase [Chlorobiota bacterium]